MFGCKCPFRPIGSYKYTLPVRHFALLLYSLHPGLVYSRLFCLLPVSPFYTTLWNPSTPRANPRFTILEISSGSSVILVRFS